MLDIMFGEGKTIQFVPLFENTISNKQDTPKELNITQN